MHKKIHINQCSCTRFRFRKNDRVSNIWEILREDAAKADDLVTNAPGEISKV